MLKFFRVYFLDCTVCASDAQKLTGYSIYCQQKFYVELWQDVNCAECWQLTMTWQFPTGLATYDEMCLAIVRYYPKQATFENCLGREYDHANIGLCGITVRTPVIDLNLTETLMKWLNNSSYLLNRISHLQSVHSSVTVSHSTSNHKESQMNRCVMCALVVRSWTSCDVRGGNGRRQQARLSHRHAGDSRSIQPGCQYVSWSYVPMLHTKQTKELCCNKVCSCGARSSSVSSRVVVMWHAGTGVSAWMSGCHRWRQAASVLYIGSWWLGKTNRVIARGQMDW